MLLLNTGATSLTLRKKLRSIAIALAATTFATYFLLPRSEDLDTFRRDSLFNITASSGAGCHDVADHELLHRLGVRNLQSFVQREVVVMESPAGNKPPRAQRVDLPLLDASLTPSNDTLDPNRCFHPVPIRVQMPANRARLDASHIDFAVASTVGRLNSSLEAFAHWAAYSNARILALAEPNKRSAEVEARAKAMGVDLQITESRDEYQLKYFSLLRHLANKARPETRWSSIIDDDTFFLSLPALVEALSAHDASRPIYLGGLSESVKQIHSFGVMAFGGAGIFFTRPLLDKLDEVYESCQSMGSHADRQISHCVYQETNTKLTPEYGLHQLDLKGDVSGFFEAARQPPLSVHHWKSWYQMDMAKLSAVAKICGDACLLSRIQFNDNWVLTNGFSVVHYSTNVNIGDNTMEKTWKKHGGSTTESYYHALAPLRPKDKKKFSYRLHDAVVEKDRVRQWYIHRDWFKGDRVLEFIWRRE